MTYIAAVHTYQRHELEFRPSQTLQWCLSHAFIGSVIIKPAGRGASTLALPAHPPQWGP